MSIPSAPIKILLLKMKTKLLFPTPVWIQDECGIDLNKLTEFCYFVEKEDPEGRHATNDGGWQSHDFVDSVMKDNPLSEIRQKIYELAYAACDQWGYQYYSLKMTNLWININRKGHSNLMHTHPGCILSGVYYAKVPECCAGALSFVRDFREQHLKESWGNAANFSKWDEDMNMDEYDVYPEADKMVLFPSWMPHVVSRSSSDGDRVSLSFNILAFSNHYNEIYPTGQHNR